MVSVKVLQEEFPNVFTNGLFNKGKIFRKVFCTKGYFKELLEALTDFILEPVAVKVDKWNDIIVIGLESRIRSLF